MFFLYKTTGAGHPKLFYSGAARDWRQPPGKFVNQWSETNIRGFKYSADAQEMAESMPEDQPIYVGEI